MNMKIATFLTFIVFTLTATAQTSEWKYMNKGNRAFENKDYSKAELNYMNVLNQNPSSPEALFNLGNVQLGKNNAKAAFDYYEKVLQNSNDTILSAMTCHNQGYIYQATAMSSTQESERQKALRVAIDHYKQALRLNPKDDNTRYNLALCQKLLKDSQQESQQQEQESSASQEQQAETQSEQNQQEKKDDKQTQQLLNLAKQAEKKAKEKVDKAMRNRRPKSLEKNW